MSVERSWLRCLAISLKSHSQANPKRCRFRPALLELESRLTPSGGLAGVDECPATFPPPDPSPQETVVPSPPGETRGAEASVRGLVDFVSLPSVPEDPPRTYVFRIVLTVPTGAGTLVTETYPFTGQAGTSPGAIRDTVIDELRYWEWDVAPGGSSGVIIRGKRVLGSLVPLAKLELGKSEKLKGSELPRLFGSPGIVERDAGVDPWSVSFFAEEGVEVLEQDASLHIALNDGTTEFGVGLTAGMTPQEVAYAIYEAMISYDMDAVLTGDGNVIEFQNLSGQSVENLWLLFYDSSLPDPQPVNWFAAGIGIPGA